MNRRNKLFIFGLILLVLFTVSSASASENVTGAIVENDENVMDNEINTTIDDVNVIEDNVSDNVAEDLSTVTVYNEKHKHAAGDPTS